jgi:hypothetical protein
MQNRCPIQVVLFRGDCHGTDTLACSTAAVSVLVACGLDCLWLVRLVGKFGRRGGGRSSCNRDRSLGQLDHQSLGTIVKFGVVALWAVVGLGILAAPLWLRRQRIAGRIPESYSQNYRYRNEPRDVRFSERRDAGNDFKDMSHKRGDRDNSWRDREAWQQRAGQGYGEAAFLRDAVRDMMGKYRGKKKRKRDRDDDDD